MCNFFFRNPLLTRFLYLTFPLVHLPGCCSFSRSVTERAGMEPHSPVCGGSAPLALSLSSQYTWNVCPRVCRGILSVPNPR